MDETSQLPRCKILPLIYNLVPGVERVAFIGDRAQLPPFGDDGEEAVSSAFNSFINAGGDPNFLEIQYRVPSPIAEILSRVSYQGRLQTWGGKIIPPSECLMWVDVAGEQLATGDSRSNIAEAETIANTIITLQAMKGRNMPTTVLSFYLAQLALIRNNLSDVPDVEVSTVDSYQGRVRERVFISLLNTKDVGFLNDIRRVNVALSRVRDELWLVGDRSFWVQQKKSCPAIAALAQLAEEHDCIL